MSKGEELIATILKQENIKFEREKTFQDLRKGKYRYDFYIEDLRGRRAVIEYHGQQHFQFISKFYKSDREWRAALERDRMKISYAISQDIDIYIIPYWDYSNLRSAADLFKPQYKARNRWHTDQLRLDMPQNLKV